MARALDLSPIDAAMVMFLETDERATPGSAPVGAEAIEALEVPADVAEGVVA